jgi:osmoprotectant transport system permease protein
VSKPGLLLRLLALVLLVWLVVQPSAFSGVFGGFVRPGQPVIYNQGSLLTITISHLLIVLGAIVASAVIAISLAILVTRPFGADFLSVSRAVANIGQTFPPVAVLALCVPLFGFGTTPTLVALFLYGLLPIFENTLTGLSSVPETVTEAARGMGMTPWQRLIHVELALALPMILAGLRLSTTIALSTATIGSTVAARTLGEVIIAGLQSGNTAFVAQGGLIVGLLAVLIHDGFVALEHWQQNRIGR